MDTAERLRDLLRKAIPFIEEAHDARALLGQGDPAECVALLKELSDLERADHGLAMLGKLVAAPSPFEDDQEGEVKWLPIETAPRDGTEVLLGAVGDGDLDFYRWHAECGKWFDRGCDEPGTEPTHWMIVQPPADLLPVHADTHDDEGR